MNKRKIIAIAFGFAVTVSVLLIIVLASHKPSKGPDITFIRTSFSNPADSKLPRVLVVFGTRPEV